MPRNNNMDNSFERFFQKKAEEYDIIYNEADWEELESNLDLLDKQRAIVKKRFLAGAAIVLIFSLLGFFTYNNYVKINKLEQQLMSQSIQARPGNSGLIADKPSKEDQASKKESEDTLIKNDPENSTKTEPSNEKQIAKSSDAGETDVKFLVSAAESQNLFISDISYPQNAESDFAKQQRTGFSEVVQKETLKADNAQPFLASMIQEPPPEAIEPYEIQSPFPRFSLGLSLAPDFSTAGSFSDFYNPGYKIGAHIEYNFNRNFGISAGIIHSTTRYTASGGEYRPPEGYWTNGTIPTETLAKCILLDIPITLKYNFLHLEQSRFYATAGISSYIMLNEEYQFEYYDNGSGLVQNWSEKTGTRHWASNAAFSIGYEYDINSILSIRAEPFIKVPLREVGWGNVKLYSLGTFISLNYKFH